MEATKTDSSSLDDMLAGIAKTITDEDVADARAIAEGVAEQEVVMHVRMFAAAPEDV